jgi:hypothetical protein
MVLAYQPHNANLEADQKNKNVCTLEIVSGRLTINDKRLKIFEVE